MSNSIPIFSLIKKTHLSFLKFSQRSPTDFYAVLHYDSQHAEHYTVHHDFSPVQLVFQSQFLFPCFILRINKSKVIKHLQNKQNTPQYLNMFTQNKHTTNKNKILYQKTDHFSDVVYLQTRMTDSDVKSDRYIRLLIGLFCFVCLSACAPFGPYNSKTITSIKLRPQVVGRYFMGYR